LQGLSSRVFEETSSDLFEKARGYFRCLCFFLFVDKSNRRQTKFIMWMKRKQ
jgi:hypothetical protein